MPQFQTDPRIIAEGKFFAPPIKLVVHLTSGNVQIQLENPSGNWETPNDPSYTIETGGSREIARASEPAIRIVASGDAQFYVNGG